MLSAPAKSAKKSKAHFNHGAQDVRANLVSATIRVTRYIGSHFKPILTSFEFIAALLALVTIWVLWSSRYFILLFAASILGAWGMQ